MPYGFNDDKSKFDLSDIEPIEDTGWNDTGYSGGGKYRMIGNIVEYRYEGNLNQYNTTTKIDEIPTGYRPTEQVMSNVTSYDGTNWNIGRVRVQTNGQIYYVGGAVQNASGAVVIHALWFTD